MTITNREIVCIGCGVGVGLPMLTLGIKDTVCIVKAIDQPISNVPPKFNEVAEMYKRSNTDFYLKVREHTKKLPANKSLNKGAKCGSTKRV